VDAPAAPLLIGLCRSSMRSCDQTPECIYTSENPEEKQRAPQDPEPQVAQALPRHEPEPLQSGVVLRLLKSPPHLAGQGVVPRRDVRVERKAFVGSEMMQILARCLVKAESHDECPTEPHDHDCKGQQVLQSFRHGCSPRSGG
jgi:hypothetical protein